MKDYWKVWVLCRVCGETIYEGPALNVVKIPVDELRCCDDDGVHCLSFDLIPIEKDVYDSWRGDA